MNPQQISLAALIQESINTGAAVTVRVEQDLRSQKWLGQFCLHLSDKACDRPLYELIGETGATFDTAEEARHMTQSALDALKSIKFEGITKTTFFDPAKISAAMTVRENLANLRRRAAING